MVNRRFAIGFMQGVQAAACLVYVLIVISVPATLSYSRAITGLIACLAMYALSRVFEFLLKREL